MHEGSKDPFTDRCDRDCVSYSDWVFSANLDDDCDDYDYYKDEMATVTTRR